MWNEQNVYARIEGHRVRCQNRPGECVSIVSGDEEVRSRLQRVLSAQGLHVAAFETAAGYMACVHPDVPGDVVLPDMSGLDLQERIAPTCPPVLFVTRHAEIAHSVRAIRAGALDFLTLPFDPGRLLGAIRSAIALDASTRATRKRLADVRDRFERVTPRERQVLEGVVRGLLNKQVAAELGISEITVQVHRRHVMRKMGAASFADLVRIADILRIACEGGPKPDRSHGWTPHGAGSGAAVPAAS
jgi:FixJ family two-component response regulator